MTTTKAELVNDLHRHVQLAPQQHHPGKNGDPLVATKDDDDDDDEEQQQQQKKEVTTTTNGQPNQQQQGHTMDHCRLPGAYSVVGINGSDDDVDFIADDNIAVTEEQAPTPRTFPSPSVEHLIEPLATSIVEDEDVVRARVQTRVTERIVSETVEATIVRSINKKKKDNDNKQYASTSFIISVLGFLFIVSVAIALAIKTSNNKRKDGDDVVVKETEQGTDSEVVLLQSIILSSRAFDNIGYNYTTLFTDQSTPQYQALQWLKASTTAVLASGEGGKLQQLPSAELDDDEHQHIIERYALAVLYYATNGPSDWINAYDFLNSSLSVCEWTAAVLLSDATTSTGDSDGSSNNIIRCNEDRYITALNLDNFGLNGTLPMELASLNYLEEFSVGHNINLKGSIPSEYGTSFTRLEAFQIVRSSQITGTIPSNIETWRKLKWLTIMDTSVTGTIPSGIAKLRNLERVFFSRNHLTGTIPKFGGGGASDERDDNITAVGGGSQQRQGSSSLTRLHLDGNMLHGTIPESIYSATSLEEFVLNFNNEMNGSISTLIGKLSNSLQYLGMYNSQLTGTIPTELGLLTNIWMFDFVQNLLTGTIPSEIGRMSDRLNYMYIHINQLTGTIPTELGNLNQLKSLFFGFNNLSGTLPSSFASLPSLENLNVQNTTLSKDSFNFFCSQSSLTAKVAVSADCGNDNDDSDSDPEVICDCCAVCRSDDSGEKEYNAQRFCELKSLKYTDEEMRGSKCDCSSGSSSSKNNIDDDTDDAVEEQQPPTPLLMTCSTDTTCETCTKDDSVCAINTEKRFIFDDIDGRITGTYSKYQYTKGINDTVVFQDEIARDGPSNMFDTGCSVYVNGEKCRSCTKLVCRDGFFSWRVSCDNVIKDDYDSSGSGGGGSNYDSCDTAYTDYKALTIFALQDPFLRNGCRPWLMDVYEDYNRWE